MYEFIKGKITELTPAYAVIENSGIGYLIHISLNTYSRLNPSEQCTLLLHHVVREDAQQLFGFHARQERELFRLLISVSGIGPNTARMMLSSSNPGDIQKAISTGSLLLLKSIKGIGQKTAERIIVELRDKILKVAPSDEILSQPHNTIREEALSALIMLGFGRNIAEKVLDKLLLQNAGLNPEELVKQALKQL